MKTLLYFLVLCLSLKAAAQTNSVTTTLLSPFRSNADENKARPFKKKLFQRNHGAIVGLQKGTATAFELGGEAHWRKLSLFNPHIIGASTNLEYNFGGHVLGYKAGMWMKRGRVNLTYGGNVVYFTDFKGLQRYGLGPSVGFRLLGFHLINGYNFLAGDKELTQANTLHMTLRYYFPVQNKFTWDQKTRKHKEKKRKERARRKEQKNNKEEQEEKKGIRKLLDRVL
jgi:hypothetical protein